MRNAAAKASSNALTMAVLMAGTFVFVLDFFIVNVAIPSTQSELGATDAQVQLIVATFGTAVDVTVAELSIESFFPADGVTAAACRAFAPR